MSQPQYMMQPPQAYGQPQPGYGQQPAYYQQPPQPVYAQAPPPAEPPKERGFFAGIASALVKYTEKSRLHEDVGIGVGWSL
ncbi:Protein of unknown function [Pyronema omphalodes CBS 100304]|uniref:Cysteine-rich transmembrane CYSTM domain-containing protein n=1 Tax=Pyronema omphalodes (strain CBS 100304) TaxID=1076935 RepID=U4LQ09_PYROM|nr:Protein of unknown function [Pyronema omphalodes CBS 100304]